MRLFISLLLFLSSLPAVFAQLEAKNFPNLVIYHNDPLDPYLEVWYAASIKKLESGLQEKFQGNERLELDLKKDSAGYTMSGITTPMLSGSNYTLSIKVIESNKAGKLLRFHFANDEPAFDMLNPQMGIFKTLANELQDIIDDALNVAYYDEDQQANTMYLFRPKEAEQNLSSYLFMYSKEAMDSSMKKLSEWFVLACEKPRVGSWLNDSTFRIDDLRQPGFGTNESFSLTIIHSMVQGDYHQYEIYLSYYYAPGDENNYQVRPYDIHKRLWRYYNTLLFIEKTSRR